MLLKTMGGVRVNSAYVVSIEEIERTADGNVRCRLTMHNGEVMVVIVGLGDLNRLDNGA